MLEEDEVEYDRPYTDENLRECLALTPDLMRSPKQPQLNIMYYPKIYDTSF